MSLETENSEIENVEAEELEVEDVETDNQDSDPLAELEKLGFSAAEAEMLDNAGLASRTDLLEDWKGSDGFPEDSAGQIIDFVRVDPEQALDWRRTGLSSEECGEWQKNFGGDALGIIQDWQKAGVAGAGAEMDIEQVSEWVKRGFNAEDAAAWQDAGFTAMSASTWVAVECLSPNIASAWTEMEFTPELARRILFTDGNQLSAGWVSPGEVEQNGVTLSQLRAPEGEDAAKLITHWGQYFDLEREEEPVSSIFEWMRYGIEDPEVAVTWVKAGCSPESAFEWHSRGCVKAEWAYDWWEQGFSALLAYEFLEDRLGTPEWDKPDNFPDEEGNLPSPDWKDKQQAVKDQD